MAGINESYLDILVTILSIIGGVFGGIPAILNWISRPRLRLKYSTLEDGLHIFFTIANEGIFSKDATELEIKCSLLNIDRGSKIESGFLSDRPDRPIYEVEPKSKILIDALPRRASTDIIFFQKDPRGGGIMPLPRNFELFIYLKYREGKTILNQKFP